MATFTAAPLATIDIAALKPSRHLIPGPPTALPYRDELGRVSLHLVRDSFARVESGAISAPVDVVEKLAKWLKHAEFAIKSNPSDHTWTQDLDGGSWSGPEGEHRVLVTATVEAVAAAAKRMATDSSSLEAPCKKLRASATQEPIAAAPSPPVSSADTTARKVSMKGATQQTRYGTSKSKSAVTGIRTEVVKGLAAVDPSCPIADSYHVHSEGAACVYSAYLNQTNIAANNNKYYIIQLLASDDGKGQSYQIWNRWGRVGEERGYQNALRGPMSLAEAKKDFEKKFHDKTKNDWADRESFETVPGKYTLIERDYGKEVASSAAPSAAAPKVAECTLEPRVRQFMELISDVSMIHKQMRTVGFDAERMPLGKLKPETLGQARHVLKALAAVLVPQGSDGQGDGAGGSDDAGGGGDAGGGDDAGGGGRGSSRSSRRIEPRGGRSSRRGGSITASVSKQVLELSNQFYSLVPHISYSESGGTRQRLQPIGSAGLLQQKIDLLEALSQIELASSVFHPSAVPDAPAIHPLDASYAQLHTELTAVEPGSPTHTMIADYLQKTHAPTHNSYTLELQQVLEVRRDGEAASFSSSIGNRMLLWHGSRLTNWAGILRGGLRVAPPEAPATGYMFGKGIYFADMSSKSANYCFASTDSDTGVLLLSEVALGVPYELTKAEYEAAAKSRKASKHSTFGVGKTGPSSESHCKLPADEQVTVPVGAPVASGSKESSLLYNEYIVYDPRQVKQRYVLTVKFKFK